MMKKIFTLSHTWRRDLSVMAKMLMPVAFILLVFLNYHTFVIHAVEANLAINFGIIGAASYGVILIMMRLINAMIDFRIIERFGSEALQGVYMKTLLEQPWLRRRYVRHYLGHIAETGGTLASQLDQNAIESELHALTNEYESKMELPQFLVGFMIAMGLLGTFIGLLETLTGISGMLDGMGGTDVSIDDQFMKLVVELRKPLAGMGIAFSASMFGLVSSLMLSIMMTTLRRFVSRVILCARNVMHDLVEFKRPSTSGQAATQMSPAAFLSSSVTSSGGASSVQSSSDMLVASRMDILIKKIDLLITSFESSVSGTQKLHELLSFGPKLKETSERTIDELKALLASHVEQRKISQSLVNVNTDLARGVTNLVEAQRQTKDVGEKTLEEMRVLIEAQTESKRFAQKMVDINGDMARNMTALLDEERQSKASNEHVVDELRVIAEGQSHAQRLYQQLIDISGEGSKTDVALLEAQRQSQMEVVSALRDLGEHFLTAQGSSAEGVRDLAEIKENFIKLCSSLGIVELISTGVGHQTLLLETLVDETRATQRCISSIQGGGSGGGSGNPMEPYDIV